MAETSIDKLTLDIVVNNDNATRRINNITKAIEKLNTAMGKSSDIDKVLDKINNVSPTSTRGGSTSGGGSNKTSKNLNIFATLGKWNYLINMARYYGRSLANMVQLSMDYVETQNLWQVANRNNLEMAEEFIQKMNKAYGVSEATLMNYQAIFKNMLSALGDLSDEISSGLSMQLTQMALDFSSLYNVTIPSAMQKFQAVLSGQVRPIRSISGYDITENTIFDLYAGAGGEKTMRQLSQIEKRLLRIVAVFDQMSSTGATGDMAKTIESASNQARIMSEQFKETMTWTGQIILMWMDSIGVFQYINAFLITMKEIIRAIAYDMGYSEKNFLDGLVTNTEQASDAIDEIQGKLLSFDKFEALNSGQDNILGIDQTVLDLLERINYQTEDFTMKSQEMAQSWLKALGFIDENGDGILDITAKARNLLTTIESIATTVGVLLGMKLVSKVFDLTKGMSLLQIVTQNISNILSSSILAGGIYVFIQALKAFNSLDIGPWQKVITVVVSLAAAIASVVVALKLLQGNWAAAIGVGALVASAGLAVGGSLSQLTPKFAEGGFPEDGLFFANSGELVGGFSNGRTAVANNEQITTGIAMAVEPAVYRAVKSAMSTGNSGDIVLKLDGKELARANVGNNAKALSSSYRIDLRPR